VASFDKCLRGRVFAPEGMLKLVFDRDTLRILGVHIIGTDACEVVYIRHTAPLDKRCNSLTEDRRSLVVCWLCSSCIMG
jgi:pyruvate/2-oxoglutarate dehydrogenase complex dihydrolipoamide dehydrogenase (E3) component